MATDLVCNMQVDERTAQYTYVYQGAMYYFCAPLCKRAFVENPEKFIQRAAVQTRDPVCHMPVNERSAIFTTQYQGKTYYFCSVLCKRTFEAQPENFVNKPT